MYHELNTVIDESVHHLTATVNTLPEQNLSGVKAYIFRPLLYETIEFSSRSWRVVSELVLGPLHQTPIDWRGDVWSNCPHDFITPCLRWTSSSAFPPLLAANVQMSSPAREAQRWTSRGATRVTPQKHMGQLSLLLWMQF